MRYSGLVVVGVLIVVLSGCAATQKVTVTPGSDVVVEYLRCEYKVGPLGIDVAKPRLSWIMKSDTRGQKQTAYQIIVASSPDKLAADTADLWDSGVVKGNQTNQIEYAGKPLKSQMRCWWKVRAWDKAEKTTRWSEPASWTMGLLKESDWKGQWIGFDEPLKNIPVQEIGYLKKSKVALPKPRYLRKDFTVPKEVKHAAVYASALGVYELHINGAEVGNDFLTPGWTDYTKRVYYNTYDVTQLLRKGDNAIAAILADGWYAGYLGWEPKRDNYGNKTRFLAQLSIEYTDGSTEIVCTDPTWKAATGPLIESDLYMGETYDAGAEMPGWDAPGFADSTWKPVDVGAEMKPALQAYPGVTVRQIAEVKPLTITEPNQGVYVLDMGKNFAGFVRLKVKANKGDRIVLNFAERLNLDGTVYLTNLRNARAMDTYICKGGASAAPPRGETSPSGGEETWQPRFTFHGFQYVQITGFPGKPAADDITGVVISSDTPVAGSFQCSNETANKLYRNIVTTQRSNFIDIPTDCPQRDERLGWMGDAQIFIRAATYNTDVSAFFTKWLVDVEDAQAPGGAFPDVAPRKIAMGGGTAAWGDAGTICPWTIYQVYGDKRQLEQHFDAMVKWIDFCVSHSKNLIRPAEGYGDWLSIKADTAKEVLATAYFAHSARLTAQAAKALGKTQDAEKYEKLFKNIAQRFNEKFVPDDGKIKSNTQTAYVLALAFDLLPADKRALARQRLLDDISKRGWHLSTGFVGTKDLMATLTAIGSTDVAYKLFEQETFPSWFFSIKQGATSIWERWDGWTPEKGFQDPGMNSFAHYSFGAVAEWMFKTIAGIDTEGPGFRKIIIRPTPGGSITSANASYNSINGLIGSDWKIEGDKMELNVTIPANTTATVYVPAVDVLSITESGKAGTFDKARGVRFLRMRDGAAVFRVVSGSYKFSSKISE